MTQVCATCLFSQGHQCVDGQHLHARPQRQPLRNRAGRAQAGKRSRAAPEHNRIELAQCHLRLGQQHQQGRNERG